MPATDLQSIMIVEYSGDQGSFELSSVESSEIARSKTRTRAKVMKRDRRPIGWQFGTEEVSATLTVIPELQVSEVNWQKAWKDDEIFLLVFEKGLDGIREQLQDCVVVSVNDSANENGEARIEVSIEGLASIEEPG